MKAEIDEVSQLYTNFSVPLEYEKSRNVPFRAGSEVGYFQNK